MLIFISTSTQTYQPFTMYKYFVFTFFIDVITIEKTNEYFRLIYDVKGRFTVHRISIEEAKVSIFHIIIIIPDIIFLAIRSSFK